MSISMGMGYYSNIFFWRIIIGFMLLAYAFPQIYIQ